MSSNCTLEETKVRERNLLSHITNMILAANENALVIGGLTAPGQQDCEWEFLKHEIIKNEKYIFHTEAEIENERSLDRNWSTGERWEWARRNGFQRGKVALCHQPFFFSLFVGLFFFFSWKKMYIWFWGEGTAWKFALAIDHILPYSLVFLPLRNNLIYFLYIFNF